jgi:sucrose porin
MRSEVYRPLAGFSLLVLSTQLFAAPAQSIEERLARLEARTSSAEARASMADADADAARLRQKVEHLNQ